MIEQTKCEVCMEYYPDEQVWGVNGRRMCLDCVKKKVSDEIAISIGGGAVEILAEKIYYLAQNGTEAFNILLKKLLAVIDLLRTYGKQQYLAGSAASDEFWKAENEKLKGKLEELKVINIIEGRKIKKAEDVIKHCKDVIKYCKAMSVNYKINGLCLENAQNALQSISEETVAFLSRPVGEID